jgi:hypothetical protein
LARHHDYCSAAKHQSGLGHAGCLQRLASGSHPLSYQWFHNGQRIPDEAGPTLWWDAVDKADVGEYFAVVKNAYGSATSQVARLSLTIPLVLRNTWFRDPSVFGFDFETETGSEYRVEVSGELTSNDWTSITNVVGTGQILQVIHSSSMASNQFYRVLKYPQ